MPNKFSLFFFFDRAISTRILGNNQLDALFRVFIYLFHVSTCFERRIAHHQEIELH